MPQDSFYTVDNTGKAKSWSVYWNIGMQVTGILCHHLLFSHLTDATHDTLIKILNETLLSNEYPPS